MSKNTEKTARGDTETFGKQTAFDAHAYVDATLNRMAETLREEGFQIDFRKLSLPREALVDAVEPTPPDAPIADCCREGPCEDGADHELQVIDVILGALDTLDIPAMGRVVSYVQSRVDEATQAHFAQKRMDQLLNQ